MNTLDNETQERTDEGSEWTNTEGQTMIEVREWLDRGYDKFKREDYAGAIADYTRAIQLSPENGAAYYSRGLACLGLSEREKARDDFMLAMAHGYRVPQDALDLCK